LGRLAGAAWGNATTCSANFRMYEAYGYIQAGQISQKRLMIENNQGAAGGLDYYAKYDSEGRRFEEYWSSPTSNNQAFTTDYRTILDPLAGRCSFRI
jgi:hypothetical protein